MAKLYNKLKVRKVAGGYRIKSSEDSFTDIHLADFELDGVELWVALKSKELEYSRILNPYNSEDFVLGNYDRHHRHIYMNKISYVQRCLSTLVW